MRLIAPLSAVANGPNALLADARRAQAETARLDRERRLQEQIDAASTANTTEERLTRLEALLAEQREENEWLLQEVDAQDSRHKAELAKQAKDYALAFAQQDQDAGTSPLTGWELAPDLDDDDLSTLSGYLLSVVT
jgi:hypothetical protein